MTKRAKGAPRKSRKPGGHNPVKAARRMLKSTRGILTAKERESL